ncbi:hypothetical protein [Peribacillus acanthi]|uniref:hypothetical protein n=1 Tax=Peribacillus acanthi TaxID=2171554 RepID=UPI000D3E15BC|nr:hypothetical protein [Peribacillus acanthi]
MKREEEHERMGMMVLVGVTEAGEILGWDRRKVSTYHSRGVMPKPVVNLSSGPIWMKRQIQCYKEQKEFDQKVYYHDGMTLFECRKKATPVPVRMPLGELEGNEDGVLLFHKEDLTGLSQEIMNNTPIAKFLSYETVSFLHGYSLISEETFHYFQEHYVPVNLKIYDLHKEGVKTDDQHEHEDA